MAENPKTNYPVSSRVITASSMPGQPDLARQMKDVFSNYVYCFSGVWQKIESVKHPDMAGYENLAYGAVEDPDSVMESTARPRVAVFESKGKGPYGRDLRVVVDYDIDDFLLGGTRGRLTTAYDRDVRRFPDPRVGKVIYTKNGGRVR